MIEPWPPSVHPATRQRASQIGFAVQAFWLSGLPPSQSWMLQAYILPAIPLRQAAFAFDPVGQVEAVIAWACVGEGTGEALVADPNRMLHMSEWNEGEELWIMALFGAKGRSSSLLRQMLRTSFSGFRRIRGYERLSDGAIGRLRDRPIGKAPASA